MLSHVEANKRDFIAKESTEHMRVWERWQEVGASIINVFRCSKEQVWYLMFYGFSIVKLLFGYYKSKNIK